jgi:hypothetical protein
MPMSEFGKKASSLLLLLVLILFARQDSSAGQSSASATATIATSLSIEKDTNNDISLTSGDLAFGTIVPNAVGGTVKINPTLVYGSGVNGTMRATAMNTAGQNYGPAVFIVRGYPNASYTITIPSDEITIYSRTAADPSTKQKYTMTVKSWTTNWNSQDFILDSDGYSYFLVGGTLSVGPNQPSDRYSGQFQVTANYN